MESPLSSSTMKSRYEEAELRMGARLDFQRLLDGAAVRGTTPRRSRSVSPTSLGTHAAHRKAFRFATDDSIAHDIDDSQLAHKPSPLRASKAAPRRSGGASKVGQEIDVLRGGGASKVGQEIDVLRATQAARQVLSSQRRQNDADWKADSEMKSDLPRLNFEFQRLDSLPPSAPASDEQLFSELGYVMQERDLVMKEKKALQHLLVQASEEIRVLVSAEQRHVEELRSWVRQRDELLQYKAQLEQERVHTDAACEGLKLRLEEVLSQHRHDKQAWEEEVRQVLRAKAGAESAAEALRKELDSKKSEIAVHTMYAQQQPLLAQAGHIHATQKDYDLTSAKATLAERGERIASLERERDRLLQENRASREDRLAAQEALATALQHKALALRDNELLKDAMPVQAQVTELLKRENADMQTRLEEHISIIRLLKAEGVELAQYTSSRLSEQEAQHLEHVARLESEWRAIHTRLEDARRDEVCKQEAQHLDHVARLESEWRAIHTRLEDARRDEVAKIFAANEHADVAKLRAANEHQQQDLAAAAAHAHTLQQELRATMEDVEKLHRLLKQTHDKCSLAEAELVERSSQALQLQQSNMYLSAEIETLRAASLQEKAALRVEEQRAAALVAELGAVRREAALLLGERELTADAMRKELRSLEAERQAWTSHQHFLLDRVISSSATVSGAAEHRQRERDREREGASRVREGGGSRERAEAREAYLASIPETCAAEAAWPRDGQGCSSGGVVGGVVRQLAAAETRDALTLLQHDLQHLASRHVTAHKRPDAPLFSLDSRDTGDSDMRLSPPPHEPHDKMMLSRYSQLKTLVEKAEVDSSSSAVALVLSHTQQLLRQLKTVDKGCRSITAATITELLSLCWRGVAIGSGGELRDVHAERLGEECVDLLSGLQSTWGLG